MAPENKTLAEARIIISENAIMGRTQKGEAFYKSFKKFYSSTKPDYSRNQENKSIDRLVRKILSECHSCFSYVAKISKSQPSGINSNDIMHLSNQLDL